jgi:porin
MLIRITGMILITLLLSPALALAHGENFGPEGETAATGGKELYLEGQWSEPEKRHIEFEDTAPAATDGLGDQDHLFGDWGGMRSALEQRGVDIEAVLTLDAMENLRGGVNRSGTVLGNADLTFTADTAGAGWWEDGTFFLYLLGDFNFGGLLTDKVGDLQGTSNIEADPAVKVYEAWYEHRFFEGRLSLLAGLHDFNSEFDVLEYASNFINSSFGISPDISQVGPSIFPTTALALRLRARPTPGSYLLAAVYDGVPGDPELPQRTHLRLSEHDGVFTALEAGLTRDEPGSPGYFKLGAGGWILTARVDDFTGQSHDFNHGFYLIGEKTLFPEGDDGQGLGAFVQFGLADPHRNQIGSYWGAGLRYTGLIPGRDQDVAGLAVASARNGKHFLRFTRDSGMSPAEHAETVIEGTYQAVVRPWLLVQPDVQYVINPGTDPTLGNALVAGVRLVVSL